ncbi:hypothetical protein F183_A45280 [Bryobacterales bacterium F-183]|nr:hypothetical protein F183_A45280 [Bryobacterales bacterium F-183]
MTGAKRFTTVAVLTTQLWAQSADNCTFRSDPDAYLEASKRARSRVQAEIESFSASSVRAMRSGAAAAAGESRLLDPASVPQKNFIDKAIFGKMVQEGVKSAPLATDAEFVRRIYLDLTSRLPSPADIRRFMNDSDPETKRSRLINELMYSAEFADKWTWWMDEWVGNKRSSPSGAHRNQNQQGRNALHKYFWTGIMNERPLRDIARELIAGTGNNYEESTGAANFAVAAETFNGPVEDTHDTMLVRSANVLWGISHYDCLLCHNGQYHLEGLNLWASKVTRVQAQQMAAFFSRTTRTLYAFPPGTPAAEQQANFYFQSYDIQDVTNRSYSIRTSFGNRPVRTPIGILTSLTPEFSFSHAAKPATNAWRQEMADFMVKERMFSRNIANRLWKQIFNLGIVDPVDTMDPARLDPSKTPTDGWTHQATHPQLLEDLATWLEQNDFNLRGYLRLLVESNAYQLSSEYPDEEWTTNMVPLFARHYVRRLEAEEIHDAVVKASGVLPNYTVNFWGVVNWAMQLPDTVDNIAILNPFNRGNRETQSRNRNSTTLQQLALMNDSFVVNRVKFANSPNMKAVVAITSNDAAVDELFLYYLSRMPNATEKSKALAHIAKSTTAAQRQAAIEDLAWALVNKIDFVFNY